MPLESDKMVQHLGHCSVKQVLPLRTMALRVGFRMKPSWILWVAGLLLVAHNLPTGESCDTNMIAIACNLNNFGLHPPLPTISLLFAELIGATYRRWQLSLENIVNCIIGQAD